MASALSTGGCSLAQYSTVLNAFAGDQNLTMAVCVSLATYLNPDTSTADSLASLAYGVNSGWLISSGALVFIMHGGFAMVRGDQNDYSENALSKSACSPLRLSSAQEP